MLIYLPNAAPRYIEDCITKQEALDLLKKQQHLREERKANILKGGFPAYTTQVGWLGYPDDKIKSLCAKFLAKGFTAFKMKVGKDVEDDKRRLRCVGHT